MECGPIYLSAVIKHNLRYFTQECYFYITLDYVLKENIACFTPRLLCDNYKNQDQWDIYASVMNALYCIVTAFTFLHFAEQG